MNIDELTLGQIKNLKAIFGETGACCTENLGTQIVILQRGWVMVGSLKKEGVKYILENGAVIRNWGSTKGLGEIASDGPTSNTKLEPVPETSFHELTLIARMKCDESAWKNKIK